MRDRARFNADHAGRTAPPQKHETLPAARSGTPVQPCPTYPLRELQHVLGHIDTSSQNNRGLLFRIDEDIHSRRSIYCRLAPLAIEYAGKISLSPSLLFLLLLIYMRKKLLMVATCLMCLSEFSSAQSSPDILFIYDTNPLTQSRLAEHFGSNLKTSGISCPNYVSLAPDVDNCRAYSAYKVRFIDILFDQVVYLENRSGIIYRSFAVQAGNCNEVTLNFFRISGYIYGGAGPLTSKVTSNEISYEVPIPRGTHKLKSNSVSLTSDGVKCRLDYEFVRKE